MKIKGGIITERNFQRIYPGATKTLSVLLSSPKKVGVRELADLRKVFHTGISQQLKTLEEIYRETDDECLKERINRGLQHLEKGKWRNKRIGKRFLDYLFAFLANPNLTKGKLAESFGLSKNSVTHFCKQLAIVVKEYENTGLGNQAQFTLSNLKEGRHGSPSKGKPRTMKGLKKSCPGARKALQVLLSHPEKITLKELATERNIHVKTARRYVNELESVTTKKIDDIFKNKIRQGLSNLKARSLKANYSLPQSKEELIQFHPGTGKTLCKLLSCRDKITLKDLASLRKVSYCTISEQVNNLKYILKRAGDKESSLTMDIRNGLSRLKKGRHKEETPEVIKSKEEFEHFYPKTSETLYELIKHRKGITLSELAELREVSAMTIHNQEKRLKDIAEKTTHNSLKEKIQLGLSYLRKKVYEKTRGQTCPYCKILLIIDEETKSHRCTKCGKTWKIIKEKRVTTSKAKPLGERRIQISSLP